MKLNRSKVTLALLLFCAGALVANLVNHTAIARADSAKPAALTIPSPVQLSNSFTKIAKEAEPSVVQIVSTIQEKQTQYALVLQRTAGRESVRREQPVR